MSCPVLHLGGRTEHWEGEFAVLWLVLGVCISLESIDVSWTGG
jgi:hypothetical protein